LLTDTHFRLDASAKDGSHGRLVNDDHRSPNANMRVLTDTTGAPHLCLFSVKAISPGEEIRYNYGKGQMFPWRVKTVTAHAIGTAQSIEDNESTLSENSVDTAKVGKNTSSSPEQVQEFVSSSQSTHVITEANREEHMQPTYSIAAGLGLCELYLVFFFFRLLKY
jgi:SET domain